MIEITKTKRRMMIILNGITIALTLGLSVFLLNHKVNNSLKGVRYDQFVQKVDASTNIVSMREMLKKDETYIKSLEFIVNNFYEEMSLILIFISLVSMSSLGLLLSLKLQSSKR